LRDFTGDGQTGQPGADHADINIEIKIQPWAIRT
jgi:hypothetical protein